MRNLIWSAALVAALVVATSARADDDFEQLVIDNTAGGIGFTITKITPSRGTQMNVARCRLRTAEISFTTDGTAPTTSVGTLLEVGDFVKIVGHDRLVKFRAIRTTGTSGGFDCNYSTRND